MISLELNHFGIACLDLEKTRQWIKCTHNVIKEVGPIEDPLQRVEAVLLHDASGVVIELVSGPMVENIVKRGLVCYHICYAVEDLDLAIIHFQSQKALVLSPPKTAVLFPGKRVAFLQTPMGIVELLGV